MSMMLPHNHKFVIAAVLLALSLESMSVAAAEEAVGVATGASALAAPHGIFIKKI